MQILIEENKQIYAKSFCVNHKLELDFFLPFDFGVVSEVSPEDVGIMTMCASSNEMLYTKMYVTCSSFLAFELFFLIC